MSQPTDKIAAPRLMNGPFIAKFAMNGPFINLEAVKSRHS
jgi:hypothetical protein